MSSLVTEFKNFLMRGNLVELAVAFVIGVAFAAVVNSLVGNLVMPIVAAIVGKPDFSSLTFTIHRSVFQYGTFITDLIKFVSIAAAVFFFVVKPIQVVTARMPKEPVEESGPSDEERRHRELLEAIRGLGR
ncbi:MAG: large conductance mechanosensitive channel protein MscL [Actinomycetes bacterium]